MYDTVVVQLNFLSVARPPTYMTSYDFLVTPLSAFFFGKKKQKPVRQNSPYTEKVHLHPVCRDQVIALPSSL